VSATAIPILLYHSVTAACDPRFAEWAVTPELFSAHMEHLADEGYTALTVRELVDRVFEQRLAIPDRPVVITFDDGFADFHSDAWPALERHGLSATVFVTAGAVGGSSTWLANLGEAQRPMLTWSQIAELHAAGIEIGAHGFQHLQLDTVSRVRAWRDIALSRDALELAVGPVGSFAYPHGYHTTGVKRMVEQAGFAGACAVKDAMSAPDDDRYALARIVVRGGTDVETFDHMIRSTHDVHRPGRRIVARGAWRAVRRAGAEPLVHRVLHR
jgi:peptidoglycan/xylan/chitin deacetylase (PgdA/CDA1 family)